MKTIDKLRRLKEIDLTARSLEYQIGYLDGLNVAIEFLSKYEKNRPIQSNTKKQ